MVVGRLLNDVVHGSGLRAWIWRALSALGLAGITYLIWVSFNWPLTQNVVGGLCASLVGIGILWLWREYRAYSPIFQFWNEVFPEVPPKPLEIVLGYRVKKDEQRDMGYGQAMSLPLIAQTLRALGVDWADAPVKYSDQSVRADVNSVIIGGPVTNQHTKAMQSSLSLPYCFSDITDSAPTRRLSSTHHQTEYVASIAENKDCAMIVVWQRTTTSRHMFIAGGKRLGVLAATQLVCQPSNLRLLLQKKGKIEGSFQVVLGATVDFAHEKVLAIDVDTLKILPVGCPSGVALNNGLKVTSRLAAMAQTNDQMCLGQGQRV